MSKVENSTLVSGLVGAIVSSFFSFWIRSHLDKKAATESSNKLSYVYFVNLSNLVAFYEFSIKFIDIYAPSEMKKHITSQDNSYLPSHIVAAVIASELSKSDFDAIKNNKMFFIIKNQLSFITNKLNENKLSHDQTSKLPKSVVLEYSFFLSHLEIIKNYMGIWSISIENSDFSWVSSDVIYDQWDSLNRLFSSANVIRSAMINLGVVSSDEALSILKSQFDFHKQKAIDSLSNKEKLKLAELKLSELKSGVAK